MALRDAKHGFLREHRGQARRVLDEVEASAAQAAHLLEVGDVGAPTERDDAGRDALRFCRETRRKALARSSASSPSEKSKQVLELDAFAGERLVGGGQREVDVDAAAADADRANGLGDGCADR